MNNKGTRVYLQKATKVIVPFKFKNNLEKILSSTTLNLSKNQSSCLFFSTFFLLTFCCSPLCFSFTLYFLLLHFSICPFVFSSFLRELVRKKALLAMHHFYQCSSSSVEHLGEDFRRALSDPDPGVMEAALILLHDIIKVSK